LLSIAILPTTFASTSYACNALVCNNQVNAAIDAGCRGFISIDGMLESPCYGSGVQYQLEVKADKNKTFSQNIRASTRSGLFDGITIDSDFLSCGKTYTVKISRTENGSSRRTCSTRVKFEDNTPPTIRSVNQTIVACEGISEEALKKQIQFYVNDFCKSSITRIDLGRFPSNFCRGTVTIPVNVEAVDFCGNVAKSFFDIRVTRPTRLVAPRDTLITCSGGTDPALVGYPSLDVDGDGKGDVPIIESSCSFAASFTDETYPSCGNGVKLYRNWVVYDWCTSNSPITTYRQFIQVKDIEAPEITCPKDNEVGGKDNPKLIVANGSDCNAVLQGILPLVVDDCDGVVTPTILKITNRIFSSVSYNVSDPHLPQGSYFLEYRAEDGCGNRSALCKYYFDVQPGGTPIAICKDQLNIGLTGTQSQIRAQDIDSGSYDNCSPISLSIRKDGSSTWSNFITYSCSDAAANKKVHLRAMNAGGVSNTCWLDIKASYNGTPCNSTSTSTSSQEEEEEIVEEITVVEEEEEEQTHIDLPVSLVMVDASTEQGFQEREISDEVGAFELRLPVNETYQLAFDKASDRNNGVSIIDMVLVLRHILGLDRFHATYQYLAADVNGSGNVTTYDVVELRQVILGLDRVADIPAWRFADKHLLTQEGIPPMKDEMVIDMLSADKEMDILAVKVGDVSGNADPSNLLTSQPRNHSTIPLMVENQYIQKGTTVTIPIHFTDKAALQGLQIALSTRQLEIISLQKGTLAAHQYQQINTQKIAIAWDALSTTSADDDLFFEMTIQAQQSGWLEDMISVDREQLLPIAYTTSDQVHSVALQFSISNNKDIQLASSPNPFQNQTTISFYLPEAAETILTLFDVNGNLLKQYPIKGNKGRNELAITGESLPDNGVLLYQLQTVNGVFTGKMIRSL